MRCRNCGWENPDSNNVCEKCGVTLDAQPQAPASDPIQRPAMAGTNSPLRATVRENEVFSAAIASGAQAAPAAPTACTCCGYPLTPGTTVCPACGTPAATAQPAQPAQPAPANAPYQSYRPAPTIQEQAPAAGRHCTSCGTLLAPDARFCAACGAPVDGAAAQPQNQRRPKRAYGGTIASFAGPGMMGMGNFCTLRPIAWDRERIDYQPISYTGERIILNRSNTDANNQTITSQEQASLTCKDGEWYLEDLSANHSTMIRVSRPVKLNDGDIIMLGNRMFEFNK